MLFQGKELIVTDSLNNVVVVAAKSIEVNINCETIEKARTSTAAWREYITGRKDWSFTTSCLVTAATFTASVTMVGKSYSVKFFDGTDTTKSALLSGSAICTQAKITEQKGSVAKGSFVFQGTGALS